MKKYWLPANKRGYRNLSQSAMNMFLKCPRAFYFDYVAHLERPDDDETFLKRGALFHELLDGEESTKVDKVTEIKCKAMANKYQRYEAEGKIFKPTHREQLIINEEKQFVGYADDFLINEDEGFFCLGENKTAAIVTPLTVHKIMNSFQTALYAEMSGPLMSRFYMTKNDLKYVEVREIHVPSIRPLKGRGKNPTPEGDEAFFERCLEKININILVGKPTEETTRRALHTFEKVKEAIDSCKEDEGKYHCNHDMCFGFWGNKACPFLTTCHPHLQVNFTESEEGEIDFEF